MTTPKQQGYRHGENLLLKVDKLPEGLEKADNRLKKVMKL